MPMGSVDFYFVMSKDVSVWNIKVFFKLTALHNFLSEKTGLWWIS
jgi:hypothetical protein